MLVPVNWILSRWQRTCHFRVVAVTRTRLPTSPTVKSHQAHLGRFLRNCRTCNTADARMQQRSDGRPLLQRPQLRSSRSVTTSASEAPRRLPTVIGRATGHNTSKTTASLPAAPSSRCRLLNRFSYGSNANELWLPTRDAAVCQCFLSLQAIRFLRFIDAVLLD